MVSSGQAHGAAAAAKKVLQHHPATTVLLLLVLAGILAVLLPHPPVATTSSVGSTGQSEAQQLQSVFEHIYKEKVWTAEGNGSGPGSTVAATERIRSILLQAITDFDAKSMIDVPCGAMAWMPLLLEEVEATRPKFKYLGLDIAESVVEQDKRNFRNKRNWEFATMDMVSQPLPHGYDLIHTRDALMHLSCRHVVAALQNLAKSGARYLLVGSYNSDNNTDIQDGQWRAINLRVPPFSLSRPLGVFLDDEMMEGHTKVMLLYSIADLCKEDFQAMKLRCSPHAI